MTNFQVTLLENLVRNDLPLRNGGSKPVLELIEQGLVKKDAGVFVATKDAKKALKAHYKEQ